MAPKSQTILVAAIFLVDLILMQKCHVVSLVLAFPSSHLASCPHRRLTADRRERCRFIPNEGREISSQGRGDLVLFLLHPKHDNESNHGNDQRIFIRQRQRRQGRTYPVSCLQATRRKSPRESSGSEDGSSKKSNHDQNARTNSSSRSYNKSKKLKGNKSSSISSFNKSSNKSSNKSGNKSVNNSINKSVNKSVNKPVNKSIKKSIKKSLNYSMNKSKNKPNLFQMITNPYAAGSAFRSTVESAFDLASAITSTSSVSRLPPDRRSIYYNYYLDDRLGLSDNIPDRPDMMDLSNNQVFSSGNAAPSASVTNGGGGGGDGGDEAIRTNALSSPLFGGSLRDDRPEVLVVGAAGSLGRTLVKRLLLESKVRVRVLVRDLYSSTLNKLGTGVTYCQGDLRNMESLEYAVTDVDKIVFCAGGGRLEDEDDNEFEWALPDQSYGSQRTGGEEWERMESILEKRSQQAKIVDSIGLRNLVHAYQNVRHADYGTSQAAKRVLFKFRKRPEDFSVFDVDYDSFGASASRNDEDHRHESAVPTVFWKQNKFGHGAFFGKVPRHGEAAISSVRLRSRSNPSEGIDLRSSGFAGLVCRICSDGGVYEAFVRTESYERLGVEYVCEFRTASKSTSRKRHGAGTNRSFDKFSTVRLEFSDFRPRMRKFPSSRLSGEAKDAVSQEGVDSQNLRRMKRALLDNADIPPFVGRDIRQIGFRYRGENNPIFGGSSSTDGFNANGRPSNYSGWGKFYLALDYIKVYRSQPEPEFIYLSDARIPPVVQDGMVRHDICRLTTSSSSSSYSIMDEEKARKVLRRNRKDRSEEETYYKYQGEEIIKQSGLSYTIIRVAGYNESPSTDSSAVRLQKTNKDIAFVSRADVAQVCASALLEPNACNLVLYMTKTQQRGVDGDIWQKFARLRLEEELPFQ